jgi:hypothetical protein
MAQHVRVDAIPEGGRLASALADDLLALEFLAMRDH